MKNGKVLPSQFTTDKGEISIILFFLVFGVFFLKGILKKIIAK